MFKSKSSFKKNISNILASLVLVILTITLVSGATVSTKVSAQQVGGTGAPSPAVTGSGAPNPAIRGSGAGNPAVTGSGAASGVTGSGAFGTSGNSGTNGNNGSGTTGGRTGGFAVFKNPLKVNNVDELLDLAVQAALRIGTVLAVLALMWVGFQFIIAQGDESKITAAKEHLWYVVIGIAVLFGATLIVAIIKATLSPFVNTTNLGSKP